MKNVTRLTALMLLCFAGIFTNPAIASSKSDLAKEQRWADQIVPDIIVGEDVMLKAGDVKFLALFTRATAAKPRGAVILIHGMGAHPAWPDVIEPLRTNLPDKGWHTLSLQMPVLQNEATDEDYSPLFPEVPGRIQAGVDFLKAQGINNIIISGHSTGAVMASYYLATHPDPAVKIFAILSGGPGVPGDARMDSLENFRKIRDVMIIDVHGENDTQRVLKATMKRQYDAVDTPGKFYQTMIIRGAGHFYRDKQARLTNALAGWLDRQSPEFQ